MSRLRNLQKYVDNVCTGMDYTDMYIENHPELSDADLANIREKCIRDARSVLRNGLKASVIRRW